MSSRDDSSHQQYPYYEHTLGPLTSNFYWNLKCMIIIKPGLNEISMAYRIHDEYKTETPLLLHPQEPDCGHMFLSLKTTIQGF